MEIARHVGLLIQARPFDVCFDRLSAFGGGALVLRSSDHSPALQAFWRKLSAVIDDSPLKPFVTNSVEPHVTLLRDRLGVPKVREQFVESMSWTVRPPGQIQMSGDLAIDRSGRFPRRHVRNRRHTAALYPSS